MLPVTQEECRDVLIPVKKALPNNTQELADLHLELDSIISQLYTPTNKVVIDPDIPFIGFIHTLLSHCTCAALTRQLHILRFRFVVIFLLDLCSSAGEYTIEKLLEIYCIKQKSMTLKWNNLDLDRYSLVIDKSLNDVLYFNCTAIDSSMLQDAFQEASFHSPLFIYLLDRALNLSVSELSDLIEACLAQYKQYALHDMKVNGNYVGDVECDLFSRERLLNALAVANKGAKLYPMIAEFQQGIRRIQFIAKLDALKQNGSPVSGVDYEEAMTRYEPKNYMMNTRNFNCDLKNAAFYKKFRDFLDVNNSSKSREAIEWFMVGLFESLEGLLRQKYAEKQDIIAKLTAIDYPKHFYRYGNCDFPIAPEDYKKVRKESALVQALEAYFVAKGLLPEGVFARFLGFVDEVNANEAVAAGHLFIEHTNLMGVNLHGKLSHPLQLYLMFELIKKGVLNRPEETSEAELVTDLIKLSQNQSTKLWSELLDRVGAGYSSPYELHTFMLTNKYFKKQCPLMHGYLLDSYYAHQVKAKNTFASLRNLDPNTFSNLQFVVLYASSFRLIPSFRYQEELGNLEEKRKSTRYQITQFKEAKNIIFKDRFFKAEKKDEVLAIESPNMDIK